MRALPAISALAVLLTACSIANESKRLIPPEEALYLAAQNMERLQSLQGSARVSIELPQSAEGFNAQIYYQHPDSLLIRIEYLLGADAALLAIQGENYLYYNKLNDTYLRGNIHDPYIDAFLQLPLPMRDFSKLLLGRTDLDTSLQNYEVTRLEDAYLFQQSRDGQEW
jgi:outer membrane biogenesis lipoprotein LolB